MDKSGIQTPFDKSCDTPAVSGTGLNGMGSNAFDQGSLGNGIVSSPFDKAIVPAPSGAETPCADLGQPAPSFVQVDGGSPAGSQAPWDITSSRNTIDRP